MPKKQNYQKSILVYFVFFIFLLSKTILCYDLSFDQFIKSTPSTFGLITVTHARNGVYTYFRKHIDSYGEMDCPQITQICVVWNNDINPELVGFKQSERWKRPVYFIKTPYNSMDFRYMLPKESQAKVFFSIDDDMVISCEQMRKSFAIWRSKAIGDIAPLISYGPRGFNFYSKNQQFVYTDPLRAKFYSVSLIGICWVPRFFFELYNSQRSWQINSMRELVKQKNNCDDIALNFLISYFFPELIPISLNGNGVITIQTHPSSQALTTTHYPYRNQCLKRFSQIIGYNPLRFVNKADPGNQNRFASVVNKYVIYMKRKQLSQRLVQENAENKEISMEQIMQLEQQISQEIAEITQKSEQQLSTKNVNAIADDETLLLKQQLFKTKQQYDSLLQQIAQIQQNSRWTEQNEADQSKKPNPEIEKQKTQAQQNRKIQRMRNSIDLIFKIAIFVAVSVIIMSLCLVKNCCVQLGSSQTNRRKQKKQRHRKNANRYNPTNESTQMVEQQGGI